jgi:DNA-binding NtrC family response regulator
MADPLKLANSRPAHFAPVVPTAAELVGSSAAAARIQELVRRNASLMTGVLIVGERGTDAASVARELHARGRSEAAPWIAMACADGDAARLERALFGAPKGGMSNDLEAVSSDSRIAAARGGTLFLQDVAELPSALQARIARIARDGEVRLDGEVTPTAVRFMASALPSIDGDVRDHRFRADLYRRLAASRIDLPPLRERLDDVPLIAAGMLEDLSNGGPPRSFTKAALVLLAALNWPGNLAELRAVVERVAVETRDGVIQIEQVLPAVQLDRASTAFLPAGSLREARIRFEREYIAAVLQHHGWRMAEAARTLGIQRPNLYRKARQLGIPVARTSE